MNTNGWILAAAVLLMAAVGVSGHAAEMEMSPAAMAQMQLRASPSGGHKVLHAFVGTWTYAGSFWMSPDAPAETTTGTAEHSMMFGGRFLKQEVTGPWMDGTFEGLGFTGYDNVREEYVSTWLDNMATGVMTLTGQYQPDTGMLTQSGTHSCPITGEKARFVRSEWTVVDRDHNVYTSYTAGPGGGEEYKAMEITYTRVRQASR